VKALIDGDILCYRIGFATNNETEDVAIRTMATFLEDLLMYDLSADDWTTYLTGKRNFRNDVAVTEKYKGNRKKEKPVHIQLLRDYLVASWNGVVSDGNEADDEIAIAATSLGDESIIVSLDKDFDQVQGWHYNFVKKNKYYIKPEEGLLNFYMQFLVGDRIDNIIGVDGIGPVKARKLLEGKTEQEMFDICVEKLGSVERAVENGRLLFLQRHPNQLWSPPNENPECESEGQETATVDSGADTKDVSASGE
jgi:5'-3' exonuclease